jgi:hypothetical protein
MQIIPHSFNRYELSEEETKAGSSFSLSQQAVIQNLLSTVSEEKLHLVLDPQNITAYAQQEAYLRGQLDMLRHLLDLSQFSNIPSSGE